MSDEQTTHQEKAPPPPKQGELLFSTLILILVVEFFITVASLCYGIITSPPVRAGEIRSLAFPWVGWAASMLIAPVIIMGLARAVRGDTAAPAGTAASPSEGEERWAGQLPPKARKIYDFFRNAPLIVFSLAFVALGVTLLLIDGAFSMVQGITLALVPYLPYFIGGITVIAVAVIGFMAWYRVKNNQLSAEFAFRREVMEKTGIVLVDSKGKALLPPADGREGYTVIQIPDSEVRQIPKALPRGEDGSREDDTNDDTIVDVK